MKRFWKKICMILFVGFCGILFWLGNAFMGNPISRILAKQALNAYMEETYAHQDVYVDKFGYDFKSGGYYAHILSQTSQDTEFYIDMDMTGHVTYDHYESWVSNKYTTENRLYREYRALANPVMADEDFPYTLDFGGGRLEFWVESPEELEFGIGMSRSELVLDQQYDIPALGAQYGILRIYLMDEEVSVEKAAEMALEIKRCYDEAGVPFKVLDLTLRYPHDENYQRKEGSIYCELLYEEIYEENLIERVQQAHEAKEAYFARMDAENAKLLEEAAATE